MAEAKAPKKKAKKKKPDPDNIPADTEPQSPMRIAELKRMTIAQLQAVAKEEDVEDASKIVGKMRKDYKNQK